MAQWPVDWAADVSAEALKKENTITCFRAPDGMYLPVLIDLYNGTGEIAGPADKSLDVVREKVSALLIGQIAMRALVVDHQSVIRFEMDSRSHF